MKNLKSERNSELYITWEQEASTFWQEVREPQSDEKTINTNRELESSSCEQSQDFWEELAIQRA
ncbi:MAG: hypothetical protein QNJ38_10650 [Prochloraceae cyanobacterium]|nr:hypothetical protein [Prochloraceae cyanobacterium]